MARYNYYISGFQTGCYVVLNCDMQVNKINIMRSIVIYIYLLYIFFFPHQTHIQLNNVILIKNIYIFFI